jgi:hypothetical protein
MPLNCVFIAYISDISFVSYLTSTVNLTEISITRKLNFILSSINHELNYVMLKFQLSGLINLLFVQDEDFIGQAHLSSVSTSSQNALRQPCTHADAQI